MRSGAGKIHYDVMEFIARESKSRGLAVLTYRFFSTLLNRMVPFRAGHSELQRSLLRIAGKWRMSTTTGRTSGAKECEALDPRIVIQARLAGRSGRRDSHRPLARQLS